MKALIFSLILFCFSSSISLGQNMIYPAIQGFGGVIPVPFEVEKPDPSKKYKLVIELGDQLKDKSKVGDMLDYAARMYNLHRYAEIPSENIELAIVVYSGSTPLVLSNATYMDGYNQSNPNASLLDELLKNGVQVIVCGQSMMKQELIPENIYPGVRMAVSRFTATTEFLQNNYKLIVL